MDPTSASNRYACTNDVTNTYPYYVTTGTEFTTPGKYTLQLEYDNGGEKYYSIIQTITVLANNKGA